MTIPNQDYWIVALKSLKGLKIWWMIASSATTIRQRNNAGCQFCSLSNLYKVPCSRCSCFTSPEVRNLKDQRVLEYDQSTNINQLNFDTQSSWFWMIPIAYQSIRYCISTDVFGERRWWCQNRRRRNFRSTTENGCETCASWNVAPKKSWLQHHCSCFMIHHIGDLYSDGQSLRTWFFPQKMLIWNTPKTLH